MNATMFDEMHYHIIAWHKILNEPAANISMAQMKEECYGKNDELLERMLPGKFTPEEIKKMSFEKEAKYVEEYSPLFALLPGLHDFLDKVRKKNITMAICTVSIATTCTQMRPE